MCCPRISNKHLNFRIDKARKFDPSAVNYLALLVQELDYQSCVTSCSPHNILWDFRNSIMYVLP